MTSLEWLNLSSNALTTLPDEFVFLETLLWLDLSSNQLSTLPECIIRMKTLTELNIQGKRITKLKRERRKEKENTNLIFNLIINKNK